MTLADDRFDQVEITSAQALRDWLAANHAQPSSVWLVRYKQHVADKYVGRLDVLDELLCFGWIDGLARKLDVDRTMQLISPRRQQIWTQSYKDRFAKLVAEGRMAEPGRAAAAASQKLGLWNAAAPIDALLVPDDLRAALGATPGAEPWFDSAAPSYRRNVLRWIAGAKTPGTRAKRLAATAEASGAGRKLPQL